METLVSHLPESQQLQVAGDALLRIAELCESRSELLTTAWEESNRDPIVGQGFFGEMVRQTVAVDLTELMEVSQPRQRRPKLPTSKLEGPIAAPVDKAVVLAMIDQLEAEERMQRHENSPSWRSPPQKT